MGRNPSRGILPPPISSFCILSREVYAIACLCQVRSHAKALGCNMVVGYQENTVICEDVLIMSSSGTAAVCNLDFMSELEGGGGGGGRSSFSKESVSNCGLCHIPYSEASVPFPIKLVRCGLCGRGKVQISDFQAVTANSF